MHRHADRPALVGDRPRDRLADPPGRVRRELEALAPVELLRRADEPDRALLDQVEEREALVAVALRDRDDEAEVRLDHRLLRRVVAALDPLGELDLLGGGEERHLADVLEEELQRVGRDLGLGRSQARSRSASCLGLGGDDLDLLLVERVVERVELRRRRGRARRGRGRARRRRGALRPTRSRAARAPRRTRGRHPVPSPSVPDRSLLRSGPPLPSRALDTVATKSPIASKTRTGRQTPALCELVEVRLRLPRERRAGLDRRRADELRFASFTSPDQSSSRPRWNRTVARSGNRRVSGPSRENASAGRALSKRPDGRRDLRLGVSGRLTRRLRRRRAPPSAACRAAAARRRSSSLPSTLRSAPRRRRSSCCGGVRPSSSLGSGVVVTKTGRPGA